MIQVNAVGDACPIPVVKTLQALKTLAGPGTVETLVDNRIAVENLTRLAQSKGCTIETEQLAENRFRVTITAQAGAQLPEQGLRRQGLGRLLEGDHQGRSPLAGQGRITRVAFICFSAMTYILVT